MTRTLEQELRLLFCAVALAAGMACSHARPQPVHTSTTSVQMNQAPRAATQEEYAVFPGETLGSISRCSGVPVGELARTNHIANPDLLIAGTSLLLPKGHHCGRGTDAASTARAQAGRLLAKASQSLDAADFDGALESAGACVRQLTPHANDSKANVLRARCHVVAGTAATGLDRPQQAIEEFRSALALDPKLQLESDGTSPRVRELMAAARSEASK
jgi:LysM repeat protein